MDTCSAERELHKYVDHRSVYNTQMDVDSMVAAFVPCTSQSGTTQVIRITRMQGLKECSSTWKDGGSRTDASDTHLQASLHTLAIPQCFVEITQHELRAPSAHVLRCKVVANSADAARRCACRKRHVHTPNELRTHVNQDTRAHSQP